jgi:uracil phosphoribosyltransferase
MRVHVANHPLITHKLTALRDKNTPSPTFRQLTEELVILLSYEATREIAVTEVEIETPLTKTKGVHLSTPQPLIVPVLRAGLGMLEGIQKLLPTAEVGFLGIKRNEETLEPYTYAERLPEDLTGRQVFIIDPMLATGGTLIDSINYCFDRNAKEVIAICLIGAPEGLKAVEESIEEKNVTIILGALDEKLNEVGYIVPGLGDAGDRLYGLAE